MSIHERIREFRKQKGLTQSELASLIGKSLRMIQKYEADESSKTNVTPSIEVLNDIAAALDVSIEAIMGFEAIDVAHEMLDSINVEYRKVQNEIAILNREIKEKEDNGIDVSELKSKNNSLMEIYLELSKIKNKRSDEFELYMDEYLKSKVPNNKFSSHMDKITLEPIYLFHQYLIRQFKDKYPDLDVYLDSEIIDIFDKTNDYVEMLLIKEQSKLFNNKED